MPNLRKVHFHNCMIRSYSCDILRLSTTTKSEVRNRTNRMAGEKWLKSSVCSDWSNCTNIAFNATVSSSHPRTKIKKLIPNRLQKINHNLPFLSNEDGRLCITCSEKLSSARCCRVSSKNCINNLSSFSVISVLL